MSLRGNDDDTVIGQSLAGKLLEPGPNRVGQACGAPRIEAKLDRGLDLLDVLAASAGRPHKGFMQLVLVQGDPRGNRNQGDDVVSLMIRTGSRPIVPLAGTRGNRASPGLPQEKDMIERCKARDRRGSRLLSALLASGLALGGAAMLIQPARAQAEQAVAPPTMNEVGCDNFARLHRYAEASKALCEEGRQVKPGPMTMQILAQCRALQGARFDQQPITDMMDNLTKQIGSQGIGNACQAASAQAWNLISQ
jgi:hypothetical protein